MEPGGGAKEIEDGGEEQEKERGGAGEREGSGEVWVRGEIITSKLGSISEKRHKVTNCSVYISLYNRNK